MCKKKSKFIWTIDEKFQNKAIQLEKFICNKGYMTYRDFCQIMDFEYDPDINEILLKYNFGMPFEDFCELARQHFWKKKR